jgi:hypothetical protein
VRSYAADLDFESGPARGACCEGSSRSLARAGRGPHSRRGKRRRKALIERTVRKQSTHVDVVAIRQASWAPTRRLPVEDAGEAYCHVVAMRPAQRCDRPILSASFWRPTSHGEGGRRRHEAIIFGRSQLAAHEHVWPAKLHRARDRVERTKMDFLRLRRLDNPLDVARGDSAPRHNDDAAAGATHQLSDKRQERSPSTSPHRPHGRRRRARAPSWRAGECRGRPRPCSANTPTRSRRSTTVYLRGPVERLLCVGSPNAPYR